MLLASGVEPGGNDQVVGLGLGLAMLFLLQPVGRNQVALTELSGLA